MSRVEFAAWVYKCRNVPAEERKHRQWQLTYPHQPHGYYLRGKGPKGSPWVPHPQEVRPCCQVISIPNMAAYPHVYHRHCRTLRHVCMLLNVDEGDVRALVFQARKRCACGKFIKAEEYACQVCRG